MGESLPFTPNLDHSSIHSPILPLPSNGDLRRECLSSTVEQKWNMRDPEAMAAGTRCCGGRKSQNIDVVPRPTPSTLSPHFLPSVRLYLNDGKRQREVAGPLKAGMIIAASADLSTRHASAAKGQHGGSAALVVLDNGKGARAWRGMCHVYPASECTVFISATVLQYSQHH
ncbi:uncharacterized protein ARMOST_20272 [Armillaria ostoyae]|uniref:Uncharacterized protein n=1 Tax=Armillaria ostoyae TaxID=47428 RepID=A0A284S6W0_ARMOS|nr:uncharacterized protein ARMOST_20272 [Armillaria ostoyae]